MKKSIFLIGVLFFISIFVNCVYGYTVENNIVYFENYNDFYNYIENKNITLDKEIDFDAINTRRNIILNSDNFNNYKTSYLYQFYFDNKIYLFNKKPTVNININSSSTLGTITFMLEFESTNANYVILSANSSGVVSASEKSVGATTKFTLHAFTGLGTNKQFYSKENLDFYFRGINFDLYYTGTEEIIIEKNPEFSFVPTYNENYESCNLKLDIINEPENYTLQYAINSSSSEWREFDNSVGVTVENNCLVIVRMLDVNGDEIFANSYNVAILEDMLSTTYFRVNFDNSQNSILGFTPILFNNSSDHFDIYFSYNSSFDNNLVSDGKVAFSDTRNGIWNNYTNNLNDFLCANGKTYYLRPDGKSYITLIFKIVNKHTGVTALTRTFKFNLSYEKAEAVSSTTNGKDDVSFSSGAGTNYDDTSFNNPFANLDKNSDLDTIMETAQESFTTFKALFSILPGFIWAFIISVLGIFVVLRIIGR